MISDTENQDPLPQKKAGRGRPRKVKNASNLPESAISFDGKLFTTDNPMEFIQFYCDLEDSEREKIAALGITKNQFICVKSAFKLDYDFLAEWLGVTTRSLHLKKGGERFNKLTSDKIGALLELYRYTIDVMGNHEEAVWWLTQPNELFNERSPLNASKYHLGLLKVREILFRIYIGQI